MMIDYEYDIEMKTKYGWEMVNCEPTLEKAKESLQEYEANDPRYQYRINKVRAS